MTEEPENNLPPMSIPLDRGHTVCDSGLDCELERLYEALHRHTIGLRKTTDAILQAVGEGKD